MFKVGDTVSFQSRHETGETLLIGKKELLVSVARGKGHNGLTGWTQSLGWIGDETNSCWFVSQKGATITKRKCYFKGNTK